ncbi:MAG: hypothetical protein ACI9HK_002560 [Pirellulaceae bacterium]|jgi:hypothetical protein
MSLKPDQVSKLLKLVGSSKTDSLACDDCFEHIAEFVDLHLASQEVPAALQSVEIHLQQCACCKAEFSVLLDGLRALEQPE